MSECKDKNKDNKDILKYYYVVEDKGDLRIEKWGEYDTTNDKLTKCKKNK